MGPTKLSPTNSIDSFMNLKRLFFLVKVEGLSCWPYLKPGRRYFATSLITPKKGDFVIFRDKKNQSRFLVKRVFAKERGGYLASSTLCHATGSENFYSVPITSIEGKLLGIAQNNVLN